jgi:hypothetical protein
MIELEEHQHINSDSIWLEITDADLRHSEPDQQSYPNQAGLNHARLNQLCLNKFREWLTASELHCQDSFTDTEMLPLWDVVNGCALNIDKYRLILIPTETLDRDELRVPQEWVDLPNLQGDYYLAVQIDLDQQLMNIWGFTSHRTLKQQGEYSSIDRTYSLPSDLLVPNLDILWMARELNLNEIVATPELPVLDLDRALVLIHQLSKPSPYSPRRKIDFSEWGSILNNPTLRTQLHQNRLQQAAFGQTLTPSFSLSDWLRAEFKQAIASGWGDNYQPVVVKSKQTIDRSKLINLQLELNQITVVLLVGIVTESESEIGVVIQVHPASGSTTIPHRLQLSCLDENGVVLDETVARSSDNYIQLQSFSCSIGDEFSIQLRLNNALAIERFIA